MLSITKSISTLFCWFLSTCNSSMFFPISDSLYLMYSFWLSHIFCKLQTEIVETILWYCIILPSKKTGSCFEKQSCSVYGQIYQYVYSLSNPLLLFFDDTQIVPTELEKTVLFTSCCFFLPFVYLCLQKKSRIQRSELVPRLDANSTDWVPQQWNSKPTHKILWSVIQLWRKKVAIIYWLKLITCSTGQHGHFRIYSQKW